MIADVYLSFHAEVENSIGNTKSTIDAEDRSVNEAVWLIEATTNTELGFTNDKIADPEEVVTEIVLTYEEVDENGVPIISGDQIVGTYNEISNTIESNQEEEIHIQVV